MATEERVPCSERNLTAFFFKPSLPLVIFFAAAVIKIVFLFSVRGNPFVLSPTNDEVQHLETAQAVLTNGLVQPEAFYFSPLYSYLLAGFLALFGKHLFAFRLLQCLVGALNVVTFYLLGEELFRSRRAGLAAATIALLYGVYYLYDVLLLKTTLAVLFLNCGLLLLLRACRGEKTYRRLLLSGLVFGLAAHLHGNVALVVPFVGLGLLWDLGWRRLAAWLGLASWLLGLGLGILPATVHNYLASHDFVPLTYNGGPNLYLGNNPRAKPVYVPLRPGRERYDQERFDAVSLAEAERGRSLKPSEISAYWTGKALDYAVSQPLAWLGLTLKKTAAFFANEEIEDTVDFFLFRRLEPCLRLAFLPFALVFGLAAAGLIFLWRDRSRYRLLLLFTAGSAVSIIAFFIFSRYRVPAIAGLVLLAAAAVDRALSLYAAKDFRSLAMPGAVLAVCALFSFSVRQNPDLGAAYNNLAIKYVELKRPDAAWPWMKKARDHNPVNPSYHENLSRLLEDLGDSAGARRELESTLRLLRKSGADSKDPELLLQYIEDGLRLRRLCLAQPDQYAAETAAAAVRRDVAALGGVAGAHYQQQAGRALTELGDLDQALACFDRAAAQVPGDLELQFDRVQCLTLQQRFEQALAVLTAAQKAQPGNAAVYRYLGNVYFTEKKFPEALANWRQAVQLQPDDAETQRNAQALEAILRRQQ